MRVSLVVYLLTIINLTVAQNKSDDILGRQFYRADNKAIVVFEKNGDTYFAKTIWLLEPFDKEGKPRLDKHNPNPSLQKRSLIGMKVMYNLKYQNKEWEGEAYHPAHGLTCNVRLSLTENQDLKIIGSKWGIKKTEIWKHVDKHNYK